MDNQKILHTIPKVMTIHDLSSFGRCAQTVILPILSVLKIQAIPLPTAILSTHTGGFEGFTFLDLTDKLNDIYKHWEETGIIFDGVYSGFLASEGQIEIVSNIAKSCKQKNPSLTFLADPVMGDNGEKYVTYTHQMCNLTKNLIIDADIITPNLTEACILTDTPYKKTFDSCDVEDIMKRLRTLCKGKIIVTGLHRNEKVGSAFFDENGKYCELFCDYVGADYPGTGDIFASIILSCILDGYSTAFAVSKAENFINLAASVTYQNGTPIREGLAIESVLKNLII